MGKRRDRRHAVLGGGGRRMKLDLQSNDDEVANAEEMNMSISTTVEEGGEKTGVESDERLSPHSLPGPVQVNPLSLLGQYSDEEEEEEEKVLANGSSGGVPGVAVAGQVDEQVASFLADLETSGLLKDEVADGTELEGAKRAKLPQDVEAKEKEILCEWEAVLHKESSEYYYWNKVTGETTWEKPAAYASYEIEILKGNVLQDELNRDNKHPFEDSHSRSNPAHASLAQEDVSTINNAVLQEAKKNMASEEHLVVDFVERIQLKDAGSEAISLEQAGKQDAGRDSDDGKQSDNCLETKESFEVIDCPVGDAVKSNLEIQSDPEVTPSASVIEHGAEESRQVEASLTLNTVENGEGAEDLAVESNISGGIEDHHTAVDGADATSLENSDPENIPEQPKRYDYHRILERGEVLADKFKTLAGEALRCLSLKLRLAVESDVRLSDCKAMVMHDFVDDRFWEHMDSQITRLEDLLLVEQAASSLEAEQQMVTSSVANGNDQSRPDADVHEAQGTQHQPAAVLERNFKSTAQLRNEDEDMDVDMDLDMETEDENIVGTSAAAIPVDHDSPSAFPVPLLYEASVPQPLVYTSTQPLPQLSSYAHVESLPPMHSLNPTPEAPLFPVAPLFPSVAPVFPAIQSSFPLPPADSWVPPPPPEEEWVPPPLPDQEAPPPPPDEDELPIDSAPDANIVDPSYSVPVGSSRVYYPGVTNQSSHEITGSAATQDADSSRFGVVDADTGSVHINGNALPHSVVSTGAAETTTKKSNKVRNKKRSHSTAVGASMMSNKKVSSLVNKWLAAQEELHSSDEEEEDKDLFDFEALEKKRQKEIEEWRHQTLASGGALENANFQPLGTLDWRERVKRAKIEASKLAAKQEKEAKSEELKKDTMHASDESNPDTEKVVASTTPPKRPDLKELTKGLPPGWQAFWDAESCEVYYGNLATSETSWDRPV